MPAVAIPLAGLTVLATLIGGRIGLRFSDRLPTPLALTGGERLLVLHNRDEAMATLAGGQVGILGAAGLSIPDFLDELGIGVAFGVDSTTSLLLFPAVISNDFAAGLNPVSRGLRFDLRCHPRCWNLIF
jgi:hypothetical protein